MHFANQDLELVVPISYGSSGSELNLRVILAFRKACAYSHSSLGRSAALYVFLRDEAPNYNGDLARKLRIRRRICDRRYLQSLGYTRNF